MTLEPLAYVLKDIEKLRASILSAEGWNLAMTYKLDDLRDEIKKGLGALLLRKHLEAEG